MAARPLSHAQFIGEFAAAQQEERHAWTSAEKARREAQKLQVKLEKDKGANERATKINSTSTLLKSWLSDVSEELSNDLEKKTQRASIQKEAMKSARGTALGQSFSARQAAAEIVRTERRERAPQKKEGEGATEEAVQLFAVRLNEAMIRLRISSWAAVFRFLDDDDSGLMSFVEMKRAVRETLKMSSNKISDIELTSIWHALDEDGSGQIGIAEFGNFMRLGEHIHFAAREQKAKEREEVLTARAAEGRAHRAELERRSLDAKAFVQAQAKERWQVFNEEKKEATMNAAKAVEEQRTARMGKARAEADATAVELKRLIAESKARTAQAHDQVERSQAALNRTKEATAAFQADLALGK